MDNSFQSPSTTEKTDTDLYKPGLYRYLATSETPTVKRLRRLRNAIRTFSLPTPALVVKPMLWLFIGCRSVYYYCMRVIICEPLFKAYCKQVGRGVRTGSLIHFIQGRGDIIVGNNVVIDGKCMFTFAARFSDQPVLKIGDNTGIGHDCEFVVARQITIGRDCNLSGATRIFDSNGHDSDPAARFAQRPPSADDVRPVVIGDGVWIGQRCLIFPGVRIGDGSVVSAGSVVRTHVPPYSVVAGNPARVVFRLKKPVQTEAASDRA